ncbi:MAG: MFS transporter [Candidatus Thorarchaeota archaeon]
MEKENLEIKHSRLNMASYGAGKFINEFFNIAFGSLVFFFYETEIGLPSYLTMIGYIIFAIYNAINDPLVGYLTDRPFKFTRKWGRRFPWVFIGGIPWIFSYILIFMPPAVDPNQGVWIIFIWLIFTTCLYDTFASVFNVNFYAIFPDKFRSGSERRSASTYSTVIAALGTALGSIIPPLFYHFEDLQSYITQAIVVIFVCMIALILSIPGSREDQVRIDCYLDKCEEGMERESFFKELRKCLKYKNIVAYIVAFTFYQSLVQCMIGSIPYVAQFVLEVPSEDITFIMAGILVGMVVSMPIWSKFAEKTNDDRKTIIYASIYLTLITGSLFFINNYIVLLIVMIFWGIGEGGFWVMMWPNFASAIDETIVDSGQRKEGIYNGIQTFVGRAALIAQAMSFSFIHTITGFRENATVQSINAIRGIQVHFALIPMLFMTIAVVVFWLFYDITPEKSMLLKDKLIEMKI